MTSIDELIKKQERRRKERDEFCKKSAENFKKQLKLIFGDRKFKVTLKKPRKPVG